MRAMYIAHSATVSILIAMATFLWKPSFRGPGLGWRGGGWLAGWFVGRKTTCYVHDALERQCTGDMKGTSLYTV